MTEENAGEMQLVDKVNLVDFDAVQKMLKDGVVQSLIGYTKDGEMLVAAPNRADLAKAKGEYPPPQSAQLLFGYSPWCCGHGKLRWPILTPIGYYCYSLGSDCAPDTCGPCLHVG